MPQSEYESNEHVAASPTPSWPCVLRPQTKHRPLRVTTPVWYHPAPMHTVAALVTVSAAVSSLSLSSNTAARWDGVTMPCRTCASSVPTVSAADLAHGLSLQ